MSYLDLGANPFSTFKTAVRQPSFSHLDSEHTVEQAIKSCHGVVDLCRIVSELPTTRTDIKKSESLLRTFLKNSDWFTHSGTRTENGAIAVAKFFKWWATNNPNAGFWLCATSHKEKVVAAFETAMKGGQSSSMTDTIRELLCTGYAPLFDMLNTPEILSSLNRETVSLLQNDSPRTNTDKRVADHATSIAALQKELDQMKREREAEKKEQAAEKQQRAAEKIDHEKTKELLERALKEMKAMEIHFLQRESGQRRDREAHNDFQVKEERQ